MPHLNGIDATAQIVKRNSKIGVVILSVHSDETYILRALNSGLPAEGFRGDRPGESCGDGCIGPTFLQPRDRRRAARRLHEIPASTKSRGFV
jgi:CheY-like chemotaxis protein